MHKLPIIQIVILVIYIFLFSDLNSVQAQNEPAHFDSPLKLCWEYPSDRLTTHNLASDNETIFIPTSDGIEAINSENGKFLWRYPLSGDLLSDISTNSGKLYFLSGKHENKNSSGKIILKDLQFQKVDQTSGTSFLSYSIETAFEKNTSDKLYVLSDDENFYIFINSRIIKLNRDNQQIWMSLLPSNINTKPIFSDQQIIFGLENKSLLYVNPLNGALTKERNKSFLSSGNLIKQSDIIITTDNNGSIYALDAERNKTYWKAKTGGRIISTALWNENILVSSNDNFVYLISLKNGNKRWKVRTGGRIIGNVILDSNRAVYISGGSNTALILDLNLGKIVNRITIKEDENFISSPLLINKRLIIPTQKAIYSFSPEC